MKVPACLAVARAEISATVMFKSRVLFQIHVDGRNCRGQRGSAGAAKTQQFTNDHDVCNRAVIPPCSGNAEFVRDYRQTQHVTVVVCSLAVLLSPSRTGNDGFLRISLAENLLTVLALSTRRFGSVSFCFLSLCSFSLFFFSSQVVARLRCSRSLRERHSDAKMCSPHRHRRTTELRGAAISAGVRRVGAGVRVCVAASQLAVAVRALVAMAAQRR